MNYHLFEESNFFNDNLINTIIEDNNHRFVIYKSKYKKKDKRFIYIDNILSYILFVRKLKKNDVVIFHNYIFYYKFLITFFMPRKLSIYWVFWGAELYVLNNFKQNVLKKTYKLYGDFMTKSYYLRKRFFLKSFRIFQWKIFIFFLNNKVSKVLTNINEDFNKVSAYTNGKLKYGYFSYFFVDKTKLFLNKNNIANKVLVGHSSYQGCNHIETLDVLKLMHCEITMPLSYGEEKYKEFLIQYIKDNYIGLNVNIIKNYMPYDEYVNFLSSHSTFILNSTHQVGFNNVMLCISLGMRVYLRKENTIYQYLKRLGFIIFIIQDDELCLDVLDENSKIENIRLTSIYFDIQKVKVEFLKNDFLRN